MYDSTIYMLLIILPTDFLLTTPTLAALLPNFCGSASLGKPWFLCNVFIEDPSRLVCTAAAVFWPDQRRDRRSDINQSGRVANFHRVRCSVGWSCPSCRWYRPASWAGNNFDRSELWKEAKKRSILSSYAADETHGTGHARPHGGIVCLWGRRCWIIYT